MRDSFATRGGVEYVETAGTYVQTYPDRLGYCTEHDGESDDIVPGMTICRTCSDWYIRTGTRR